MNQKKATLKDLPAIFFTFILILLPWIFFKTETVGQAVYIIKKILGSFFVLDIHMYYPKRILIILALVIFEWIQRDKEHPLHIDRLPQYVRFIIYYILILIILLFGTYDYNPFIYFKF